MNITSFLSYAEKTSVVYPKFLRFLANLSDGYRITSYGSSDTEASVLTSENLPSVTTRVLMDDSYWIFRIGNKASSFTISPPVARSYQCGHIFLHINIVHAHELDYLVNQIIKPLIKIINADYALLEQEKYFIHRHKLVEKSRHFEQERWVGLNIPTDGLPGVYFFTYLNKSVVGESEEVFLSESSLKADKLYEGVVLSCCDNLFSGSEKRTSLPGKDIANYFWNPPNCPATILPRLDWGDPSVGDARRLDLHNEMIKNARIAAKTARDTLGLNLDYSKDSVIKLEQSFKRDFKFTPQQETIEILGAYLGEAVEGREYVALKNTSINDSTIFPQNKVWKRFHHGKSDDLITYWELLAAGEP